MHVVWGCWEGRPGSELSTSTARHSTDANAEAILGRGCRAWVWGCTASGAGMGKWGWELGLEPGKQSPWLLSLKGEAGPKCHLGGGDGAQGLVLQYVSDVAGWDNHGLCVAGRAQRRLGPMGLIPPL